MGRQRLLPWWNGIRVNRHFARRARTRIPGDDGTDHDTAGYRHACRTRHAAGTDPGCTATCGTCSGSGYSGGTCGNARGSGCCTDCGGASTCGGLRALCRATLPLNGSRT